MILANVFLNQLKDRRLYAKQYADLVADYPTFTNYKNLGNALLEIQEPEDAVKAFQGAMSLDRSADEIIRKIGNCYVQMHDYKKAFEYYEAAL